MCYFFGLAISKKRYILYYNIYLNMISIGANGFQLLINYIVSIVVAIVISLVLGLSLLPEKPIRFSWTNSALFPTPIFAIGILAIFYSLNVFWIYDGLVIAIIVGLASALFVKYLFDYVFPKPPEIEGGSK